VLAILICAPIGAVASQSLGPVLLKYDGTDPKLLAKHGLMMPIEKEKDDEKTPSTD